MATILNRTTTFATNGTVTAAGLHNLIDDTAIYAGLITTQTELTTVGTADQLLIAVGGVSDTGAPRRATVQNLFDDALTGGTYTNAQLSGFLTYGTATGNRTVSTSATITTGTIPNLTSSTANITLGTIPTLTVGTTTSTAANITNGTVQTLTVSTANITTGTVATLNSTTGTVDTLNSTTGTITNLRSTTGTVATLNSTTGTITGLNTTTGTITTLNSTTGTITNLSTTLAGDFTISQGTGTIGAAKVTPSQLSQPLTLATAVASTSGTAIDFTGIPSWVKKITVMFSGVSTNGVSNIEIRLGTTSGIESSGYGGTLFNSQVTSVGNVALSTGFTVDSTTAATDSRSGLCILSLISGSVYAASGSFSLTNAARYASFSGTKQVSGTLDRIRITTVNGTDTFDAGSINIIYQG
jgi:hypothetical protein